MNFELNEEQDALRDSLARLLDDRHSGANRRAIAATPVGFSESLWRQCVELGLTALMVPESHGGLGGSATDLLVVMLEFGRSLLISPLLTQCVMPAAALSEAADTDLATRWLPALAQGRLRMAWAHDEPSGDGGALWVSTRAEAESGVWRLKGRKLHVPCPAGVDHFLVSARVTGEDAASDGRALFIVAADATGLVQRPVRLIDGSISAELILEDVIGLPLRPDPTNSDALTAAARGLDLALALAIAATCAELVGGMEEAMRLTREYLGTRKQFGRAIGQNQALRHKLADMMVGLETSRSLSYAAAAACEDLWQVGSSEDLHRAKLLVGRQARNLCHHAIQMHGGIGMTEEYNVGHYLRRAHVLDLAYGDGLFHSMELAVATR